MRVTPVAEAAMQITIDTAKLPKGTSVQDAYAIIHFALHTYVGDYEGYEDVHEERAVMGALVDPREQG